MTLPYDFLCHWGRSWRDGAPIGTGMWRSKGRRILGVRIGNYNVKKISGLTDEQYNAIMLSKYGLASTNDYAGKKAAKDFLSSKEGVHTANIIAQLPEQVEKNKKQYTEPELNREDLTDFQNRISKKTDKESADTPDVIYAPGKKQYKEPTFDVTNIKRESEPENTKKNAGSTELAVASNYLSKASQTTNNIKDGISKAWESLHNAKYQGEDRSKYVRGLTNDELRQVITRIELDQKYNKLTMPSKSKGYDRTMAALAILGAAASVTATGISIAAGIKKLKGK